jgi:hypothetical protein
MTQLGINPTPVKEFKRGEEMLAGVFFIQDLDGCKSTYSSAQGTTYKSGPSSG